MIDQKTNYLFKKSAKKYNKLPYLKAELGKIRYHNKKIISIEGVNGSGKTTQVNLLKSHFKKSVYLVPKYTEFKGEKLAYKSVALGSKYVGGSISQTLLFLAGETSKEFYISKHCIKKTLFYMIDILIVCYCVSN
jgi:predicted AAA+ superfamily ATPase